MISNSKEDFGNLGNLVVYLNGKHSLEERITFARKLFFISLNVPPQHKEEVVIVWLTDILSTNKVLTYSAEEQKLVWKTLHEYFSSRRIKALSSQHWVCPLTSVFTQTLITTACGLAEDTSKEIQNEALLICDSLLRVPSLSPQIALISKQSLKLFCSALKLTCEGHKSSSSISQLTLLLQKSSFILNNELSKPHSLSLIYEICLPLLEVLLILKNDFSEESVELIKEIEIFFFMTIFNRDYSKLYFTILDLPLQNVSIDKSTKFGESFFAFLTSLIEKEDKNKASYILREFCVCFFQEFQTFDISYQFIIIVMNLLGISLDNGPTVQKDNHASRSLLPVRLSKYNQDRFVASVLESVLITNINLTLNFSNMPLNVWLKNLGEFLVTRGTINVKSLHSLKILIQIDPLSTCSYSKILLSDLLVIDRTNTEITGMLEEVLCEILTVHVKLRTLDAFYEHISESLLTICQKQLPSDLLRKQHDLEYKKAHLLPCKFYSKFLKSITEMGSQMWMKLWCSIHRVLSQLCRNSLQEDSSSESTACVAFTVWFSSCCLSASSLVDAVSISGMPSKIVSMMNSLADECIAPLLNDMLQLSNAEKPSLCRSLLSVILVWSELHSTLFSISTQYKNLTKFPIQLENNCESSKDLSAFIPFIKMNAWVEIFSVLDDTDDVNRSMIVQLLIQKLSLIKVSRREMQVQKVVAKDSSVINILNYILEDKDPSEFPLSMDVIAPHLSTLLPQMKKSHCNVVARCMFNGIEKERESWIKFGMSKTFQENELLQSRCLSHMGEKFLVLLSGRKRKFEEEESEVCLRTHLLSKNLLTSLIALVDKMENQSNFEKDIIILADIEMLFMSKNESLSLKTRGEKQIVDILRFIDMFPISFLQPKLLLCVLIFVIIVTFEEGGFGGRKIVTTLLLRILNKAFLSRNCAHIFKISKRKSYSVLLWLQDECDELLKDIDVDESHLKVFMEVEGHQANAKTSTLQELLIGMSLLTKLFVTWNDNGSKINLYVEELAIYNTKNESRNAKYLASALLTRSVRETLPAWKSPTHFIKTCVVLNQWSEKAIEEMKMNLSKVTKVQMTWALMTLSFLLRAKLKIKEVNKQADIRSDDKDSNVAKSEIEDSVIELETIVKNGICLAEVAVATEDHSLKTLGLEFYLCVCSSKKYLKHVDVDVWDVSEKIWHLMFQFDDSSKHMKDFLVMITTKDLQTLLKVLIEELNYRNVEIEKLFQWLSAFITSIHESKSELRIKNTFFEQLIGSLSVRFSDKSSLDASGSFHLSLFTFFITILQAWNSVISNHSKSLILGMISHCSLTRLPTEKFFQTLQALTRLLGLLLSSEPPTFIMNRPSSFLSATTNVILSLLEKTDIDKGTLHWLQLKELEKCCSEIEIVAKNLKKYDKTFFKIAAFSLAAILEKMHQTKMLSSVKLSMERIICILLDVCDPYSIRHLLVTLSPSVITELKYLHSTYISKYNYDPRTA